MKPLINQVDKKLLKQQLLQSEEKRTTVSFYRYYNIKNVPFFRDFLFLNWERLNVLGRIYVASEGINGQLSIPNEHFEAFREHLYSITFLNGIRLNVAREDDGKSFAVLKVKIRSKIVADGLDDKTFDVTNRGTHLSAEAFNQLTDEKETILVDMRNHYEHEIGHFEGAILPDVDTFREELPKVVDMLEENKDKNIVMYCTGGIRCEKASAYLKHKGFESVHQLEGGIIEYARQVEEKGLKNKFLGKNFVFDERRAERIGDEIISECHQCGAPCDVHVNCANEACHLLFIQCDACQEKMQTCCTPECQAVNNLPEEEQKELRRGKKASNKIYRKGRGSIKKTAD